MNTPHDPAPAELPPRLRSMLGAYRDAESLSPSTEDRIWSAIAAAPIGTADELDPSDEHGPDPLPIGGASGGIGVAGWIGIGVCAAAAVVLAWQIGGPASQRDPARSPSAAPMHDATPAPAGTAKQRAPQRSETTATRRPSPAPASAEPAPLPGQAEPAPLPDEHPAAPTRQTSPTPSPTKRAVATHDTSTADTPTPSPVPAPTPPTVQSPTSSLAAERTLVAQAWKKLNAGDVRGALSLTATHRQRFSDGLLVPERSAIEAIARCRNDPSTGPRHSAAFHRAYPRSPLAPRVDEACGTIE